MQISLLFLTALGLAMDAFAVSVSNSMCYRNLSFRQIVANSLTFGFFQALMPLAGFFAGRIFAGKIEAIDHWVALLLLCLIGGKMLFEGIRALKNEGQSCPAGLFGLRTLLTQAVATSIDALAVGVSFAALAVNIWLAVGLIGVVTFVFCIFGGLLGKKFGALLGDWAEILGGLILVGIGIKIFVEHLLY